MEKAAKALNNPAAGLKAATRGAVETSSDTIFSKIPRLSEEKEFYLDNIYYGPVNVLPALRGGVCGVVWCGGRGGRENFIQWNVITFSYQET